MAVTNFNTSNQTFRKLMGNGLVYRVPMFQRDYSWTEQEWTPERVASRQHWLAAQATAIWRLSELSTG